MRDLGTIASGFVTIDAGRIVNVGGGAPAIAKGDRVVDLRGRVVTPGLVDCHTHACYEGERLDEWELKLAGKPYLEILAAGGGIMASVRAVRAAPIGALTESLRRRTREMAQYGSTTVEVKSGYGLDTDTEIKMLDAIAAVQADGPLRLVPTYLGAHAKDTAVPEFVERTITESMPRVAKRFPGIAADAYCEQGSWSVAECVEYFNAARALGLKVRVHTDQFNSLGMIEKAIALGAVSVDHLEAATHTGLEHVAKSATIAVGLPVASFCLSSPCIKAREFIDMGGALALATNANPGSAPTRSIPLVIAFAVREMRMTFAEAITTVTYNAACVLGLERECGSIAKGLSADLLIWPHRDERAIGYEIAGALPSAVIARGTLLRGDLDQLD